MSKIIDKKVEREFYSECPRCDISSETEGRMCPCPRGSCEAKLVGVKEITSIITKIEKED